MTENLMKFSGGCGRWFVLKAFDRISNIDDRKIFLEGNLKIVDTNLEGAARYGVLEMNGFLLEEEGDFVRYHDKLYTRKNFDQLLMVVENEKTERAINEL